MWEVLTILAVVALLFYWRRKNAVWGGMTAGVVLGLIASAVWFAAGNGFHWSIVWKWTVVCTLLGASTEILSPRHPGGPSDPAK